MPLNFSRFSSDTNRDAGQGDGSKMGKWHAHGQNEKGSHTCNYFVWVTYLHLHQSLPWTREKAREKGCQTSARWSRAHAVIPMRKRATVVRFEKIVASQNSTSQLRDKRARGTKLVNSLVHHLLYDLARRQNVRDRPSALACEKDATLVVVLARQFHVVLLFL